VSLDDSELWNIGGLGGSLWMPPPLWGEGGGCTSFSGLYRTSVKEQSNGGGGAAQEDPIDGVRANVVGKHTRQMPRLALTCGCKIFFAHSLFWICKMTIGMSQRNFTLQSIPCELFLLLHIAIGVRFRKYKCMGDLGHPVCMVLSYPIKNVYCFACLSWRVFFFCLPMHLTMQNAYECLFAQCLRDNLDNFLFKIIVVVNFLNYV
jgi:hypothetical protein